MTTIDEIFETMPNTTFEYLVIDPATRTVNVPDTEKLFGVMKDRKSERKYFMCPRYVGDNLDLSKCYIQINFDNGHDEPDAYLVEDLAFTDDIVTFSWLLTDKVVAHEGDIKFSVYANDGERTWNTTPAVGTSLEGLSADISDVEDQTADAIVQLRQMVDAQVQHVQDAASVAISDAQSQIEAKGAATLASIPDDYTTTVDKVNNLANAIKGHISGTAVRADDISPVEHYPKITVRPKNLMNTLVIPVQQLSVDGLYISSVGEGTITITSPEGYVGNGFRGTNMTLRQMCPQAVAGKTYVLNATTPSNVKAIFLVGISMVWQFGTSKVMTDDMLNCSVVFYGYDSTIGGTGDCVISNIQLEEGTKATDYVPYVDPSTVTVTRCGKNLIPEMGLKIEGTGIEWTINDDGTVIANGTAETDCVCTFLPIGWNTSLLGKTVTLSGCPKGGSRTTYCVMQRNYGHADVGDGVTFVIDNNNFGAWGIIIKAGEVINNVTFKPQVELGSSATKYEPHITNIDTTHVSTMTLLTETANVIIDCEYNRDTNIVINKLISAIQALGGTV